MPAARAGPSINLLSSYSHKYTKYLPALFVSFVLWVVHLLHDPEAVNRDSSKNPLPALADHLVEAAVEGDNNSHTDTNKREYGRWW